MFNKDLRESAKQNLENKVDSYEQNVKETKRLVRQLYKSKADLNDTLILAMDYINSLKNTPDELKLELKKISVQSENFKNLVSSVEREAIKNDRKFLLLSGLIIPTNLLAFGALAIYQSGKNKQAAERINNKALKVKKANGNQKALNKEILRVIRVLGRDKKSIQKMLLMFQDYPADYTEFTKEKGERVGAFVNCVKASSYNLNRELNEQGAFRLKKVNWESCGLDSDALVDNSYSEYQEIVNKIMKEKRTKALEAYVEKISNNYLDLFDFYHREFMWKTKRNPKAIFLCLTDDKLKRILLSDERTKEKLDNISERLDKVVSFGMYDSEYSSEDLSYIKKFEIDKNSKKWLKVVPAGKKSMVLYFEGKMLIRDRRDFEGHELMKEKEEYRYTMFEGFDVRKVNQKDAYVLYLDL